MICREPSNLTFPEIADLAEHTAAVHTELTHKFPLPLKEVIKDFGWSLRAEAGGRDNHPTILRVHEPGNLEFIINGSANTSIIRDRYTIARGLGHFMLHMHGDRQAIFYDGEPDLVGEQAHVFASTYLMPRQAFRRAFEREAGDAVTIARSFEVSQTMARNYAVGLGLA